MVVWGPVQDSLLVSFFCGSRAACKQAYKLLSFSLCLNYSAYLPVQVNCATWFLYLVDSQTMVSAWNR